MLTKELLYEAVSNGWRVSAVAVDDAANGAVTLSRHARVPDAPFEFRPVDPQYQVQSLTLRSSLVVMVLARKLMDEAAHIPA